MRAIRTCGPCSACCSVLGVPELGKGTYCSCEHVNEAGCAIYTDRPESCRTFECQWLRGLLEIDGSVDLDLRPDTCGVIFDFQAETPFGGVYKAWEVEPGASRGGAGLTIIDELKERFLVVIMSANHRDDDALGTHRLAGPPDLVARASDTLWTRAT